jgi:chromosomal replication initiator protein
MVLDQETQRDANRFEKVMKAWENLLTALEIELGRETVVHWLRPIKVARFDAGNLYLEATPFQRAWFEEQIRPRVKANFTNNNQRPIKIHWIASEQPNDSPHPHSDFQITPDSIDKEMNIEHFIVSPLNRMAFEMAKEVSQSDQSAFNPIFISGPSGCGKTHLLSALAQALSERGKKVFFVNAKTFTEHVVQAIRLGRMLEFRKAYREIDALIIDDIHILARRTATQEEFFHTFNALHTEQRLIVISANVQASRLQDIEARLISRFEWGIALNLEPPDSSVLRQILMNQARYLHLSAPEDLFDFLLQRFCTKPIASIEALHAIALRSPRNFDLRHIEQVLSDLLQKESRSVLSFDQIIEETARYFAIRPQDLTGPSQMREYVQPRQIAMFFCRNVLKMPFQGIGRIFDRDHSTVMASVRQVKQSLENNDLKIIEPIQTISRVLHKPLPR